MTARYRINAPSVVSEIIDGEAIIMNLKSGSYFSARGVAAVLWAWLERGIRPADTAAALAARYALPSTDVATAVDRFSAFAIEHGLLVEDAAAEPEPEAPSVPAEAPSEWSEPTFEVFTDLEELLLLDPIHDVEEQMGWPMPKPPEAP